MAGCDCSSRSAVPSSHSDGTGYFQGEWSYIQCSILFESMECACSSRVHLSLILGWAALMPAEWVAHVCNRSKIYCIILYLICNTIHRNTETPLARGTYYKHVAHDQMTSLLPPISWHFLLHVMSTRHTSLLRCRNNNVVCPVSGTVLEINFWNHLIIINCCYFSCPNLRSNYVYEVYLKKL